MPFGIHRRVGQRYGVYEVEGDLLASTTREQIRLLESPEPVPRDVIERFCSHALKESLPVSAKLISTGASIVSDKEIPIHEQMKASIVVRDFVSH